MTINGTSGNDTLTGTSGNDIFDLSQGGNDTVSGLGGDDQFKFGNTLNAADSVDGGSGNDTVILRGNYASGLTLGANTLVSVENLDLQGGVSYHLTMNDGNVAAGQTLAINASGLTGGNALFFDGSAETNGFYDVTGSNASDTFTMGGAFVPSDHISGGAGNDTLLLAGDYNMRFPAKTLNSIETIGLTGGFNYHFMENDANVGAGDRMTVSVSGPSSAGQGHIVYFDGSAETDGSFEFGLNLGTMILYGGAMDDGFSGTLLAADRLTGGAGSDTLTLEGSDVNLVLKGSTLRGIDTIDFTAGYQYHITAGGEMADNGNATVVDGSSLTSGTTVYFNDTKDHVGKLSFANGSNTAQVTGTGQNDTFNFVAAGSVLLATDKINGGGGSDVLNLTGDYSGANALIFHDTTITNIAQMSLGAGHSYSLTLAAGTVASGATLAITGTELGASDVMKIDASHLGDTSSVILAGGAANDVLTGGPGDDTFDLEAGGNDRASGGAGHDIFNMAGALTAADRIDGGTGDDTVVLTGDYSSGVIFKATTMIDIATLSLTGTSFNLTTNDATVAAGQTLLVLANSQTAGNTLIFNGAAETDGTFTVFGGGGTNTIIGGALADHINSSSTTTDTFTGGGGADTIDGTLGASETFVYNAVSDSTSVNYDHLVNVNFDTDIFHVSAIGAVTGVDAAVNSGALSTASFDSDLAAAIGSSQLAAHHAMLFTPDSGTLANQVFLVIDENGTAGYQASQDLVIWCQIDTGTLTAADFS